MASFTNGSEVSFMKIRRILATCAGILACAICVGLFWLLTNALFLRAMIDARGDDTAPRTMEAFPFYVRAFGAMDDAMLSPFAWIPRRFVQDSPLILVVPALFWGALIFIASRAMLRRLPRRSTSATRSR
jgi:hypothetical protein